MKKVTLRPAASLLETHASRGLSALDRAAAEHARSVELVELAHTLVLHRAFRAFETQASELAQRAMREHDWGEATAPPGGMAPEWLRQAHACLGPKMRCKRSPTVRCQATHHCQCLFCC